MATFIVKDPPPLNRQPSTDWDYLILKLSEEQPDVWVLVATDIATSRSSYLKKRYGVSVRLVGTDSKGSRAAEMYVRWNTMGAMDRGDLEVGEYPSFHTERQKKTIAARERRERLIAEFTAKQAKEAKAQSAAQEATESDA